MKTAAGLGSSLLCGLIFCVGLARAAEKNEGHDQSIVIADGKLQLTAPKSWTRKEPQTSIVEYEFAIPAVEGDAQGGRMTVMGALGSIDANIDRWKGQFSQPDGENKDKARIKKKQIAGLDVHLVDISGTFKDQRGPFAPATERPNYRMLAAIIETKNTGNYFVKFYGPEKTVAKNEKAFNEMIESLEKK